MKKSESTTFHSTQVFLLSPARCDGARARVLLNPDAAFELAERLRAPGGAPLGDVFAFLSGLYFRGKLAYARAYGKTSRGNPIILLGGIATGKYTDVLLETLGHRLLFPVEFVGRGDMSRGGLLLRHVRDGRELRYAPVLGAVRRGKRPPKLERIR